MALVRGVVEAQRRMAEETLRSAWSDVYFDTYRWALEKSWRSAWLALGAALRLSGIEPGGMTLSLMAYTVDEGCGSGVSSDASILDYLRTIYLEPDVAAVLGLLEGPERPVALDAIERAVRILGAVGGCMRRPVRLRDVRALSLSRLKSYADNSSSEAIILVGGRLMVVSTAFEGSRPPERVGIEEPPPGYTPLLLAPDEAYALMSLPWFRGAEKEVLRDSLGFTSLI